jgi:hypothetical protein
MMIRGTDNVDQILVYFIALQNGTAEDLLWDGKIAISLITAASVYVPIERRDASGRAVYSYPIQRSRFKFNSNTALLLLG